MSTELYGILVLTLVCIIISPYYKNSYPSSNKQVVVQETIVQKHFNPIIKTDNPKTIVLLSDSFLPKTFAGSELSGYETIKYLRSRGHKIVIFVKEIEWVVDEYDGFKIYKYNTNNKFCFTTIKDSDIVFFQMTDTANQVEIINQREGPVFFFIHLHNSYPSLLQHKMPFPTHVVYNSQMTQDTLPTFHDNMRMVPYVDTDRFKPLRKYTIHNNVVCLINCNKNKGGDLLKELAEKMPNVQFLGIKGGYSVQVVEENAPKNLTYMETQKDITVVFKKIGILIMPSRNETWGRTAVEAMSAGVPVIHSEAQGLVECVGGAGITCVNNDIDSWIDAINRITHDNAYRERLRQYGFKRISEIEYEQTRGRQELARKIEA